MITTGFNPYAARGYSMTTARQKQNNVVFERGFELPELKKVVRGEDQDIEKFIVAIKGLLIKKSDGASKQLIDLRKVHPDNDSIPILLDVLDQVNA